MNLINSPLNYQAACGEVIYTIADVDKDQAIDVAVYDSEQQQILGIKRFRGALGYDVNVANYLQQQFDIDPIISPICAIVAEPGRLKSVSVKIGELQPTPRTWHTFGVLDAIPMQKLSNSAKTKKIAPKEYDEISFIAPDKEISAQIMIVGDNSDADFSFMLPNVIADHNIHTLVVNMDDIEQRLGQSGWVLSDFKRISVVASADGHEFITQNYIITPYRNSSVRLCWLNQFGVVDYYTCVGCVAKNASIESNIIYVEQGYKGVGAQTQLSSTLVSEYEPQTTLQWLAELIASAKVWIIEGTECTPVCVRSQSIVIKSANLSRMELSVSSVRKTISQKN